MAGMPDSQPLGSHWAGLQQVQPNRLTPRLAEADRTVPPCQAPPSKSPTPTLIPTQQLLSPGRAEGCLRVPWLDRGQGPTWWLRCFV